VVTFYSGSAMPVFLLTVFGTGERAGLPRAECDTLANLTGMLVEHYRG
jgi:hypothetical protein